MIAAMNADVCRKRSFRFRVTRARPVFVLAPHSHPDITYGIVYLAYTNQG
jgi:hypothetical protein